MSPIVSIVTIHKGSISDLKKTVESIYSFHDHRVEHIVVANLPRHEIEVCAKICPRSTIVVNEDKSLYDAMNIGLRKSRGEFINFINSGDVVISSIDYKILTEKTCYIFKETIAIDGSEYVSNGECKNHQNFLAPNDRDIIFEEEYLLYADAKWMNKKALKYGEFRCGKAYSAFEYGGLSTKPTIRQAIANMRIDEFLMARFKLLIKAVIISAGLERLNKMFLLRGFHKCIQ